MKYTNILLLALAAATGLTSCSDDDNEPGNPVMEVSGNLGSACFGDSLKFTVKATDSQVPLSTIHAELYFGDEMVGEKVIRTKESGVDYEGKIYVPYLANIPDGKATLKLVLQNIHFTTTEQTFEVKISHADYPYLTLQAEDGTEYRMTKGSEPYVYTATDNFPSKLNAKIITPVVGEHGNELVFGYENSDIIVGGSDYIPFSNTSEGYTISFNTYTLQGSPFLNLSINGQNLVSAGDGTSYVDLTLSKGNTLVPDGFPNWEEWWVSPDFFVRNDDGTLTFNAYRGSFRIIADPDKKYLRVYKLDGLNPATLNSDGTGALWIIGEGIGQPSLANQVGWVTENAICMANTGSKTYQITLVGGETIATNSINFKFFGSMGWDGELTGDMLVSQSDLIGVGTGSNGHDTGNLFLKEGVTLEEGATYVITVDLNQGVNDAILKCVKQ